MGPLESGFGGFDGGVPGGGAGEFDFADEGGSVNPGVAVGAREDFGFGELMFGSFAGSKGLGDEGEEESHFDSKENPHWKRNQEIERRSLFA